MIHANNNIQVMNGTVLATLGQGRYGRVVCIRREDNDEESIVAVKQYDRQKAVDAGRVNRILEEKAVLQQLNCCENRSPYIVKYLDTAKDDETLYIIMEAVLGGPLHRHIELHGKLPLDHVRLYMAQLISCCEYMARNGCLHRDIKASNCILDEKGHIKLCDFGCAKRLFLPSTYNESMQNEPVAGPRTFTLLGSHHAMPLEMLNGEGYGISVDWWAIGVLFYEMVTGEKPFDNLHLFSSECPRSNLDSYDWNLYLENTNEDCSIKWKKTGHLADDLWSSAKDLISVFLNPVISERWGAWNVGKVRNSKFFQGVDMSLVEQGVSAPIKIDQRLGVYEIVNKSAESIDVLSDHDQSLFAHF